MPPSPLELRRSPLVWMAAGLLVACSDDVVRHVGDAMVEAGTVVRDAAGSADAQIPSGAPTVIDVICSRIETATQQSADRTQLTTVSFEYVPVADPRRVMVERCGYVSPQLCATGATCTGTLPVPSCGISPPTYEPEGVYVECSRRIYTVDAQNNILSDRTIGSSSQRVLVWP